MLSRNNEVISDPAPIAQQVAQQVAQQADKRLASRRLRYPSVEVIVAAALVTVLGTVTLACSGKSKIEKTTPKDTDTTTVKGTPDREPAPLEGVACTERPCMIHQSTGAHHYCLNAGSGLCFQYGGHCSPADSCMLDPKGVYRTCTTPTPTREGGRCAAFGDVCEPATSCGFDKVSNRYRLCTAWQGGQCSNFSTECTPG